jgi:hypothetical protein
MFGKSSRNEAWFGTLRENKEYCIHATYAFLFSDHVRSNHIAKFFKHLARGQSIWDNVKGIDDRARDPD